MKIKKICVFCGSSQGSKKEYTDITEQLGKALAQSNIELIYGGAHVGLMGTVADSCLQAGGKVTGVIPEGLKESEIAHYGLTNLEIVSNMHERKARMAELADAFISLPGGAGTMEEFFEQWTWAQLGYHQKPCGFLNILGYYDALFHMIDRMVEDGFLNENYQKMLCVDTTPLALIKKFQEYIPPQKKWT